MRSRVAATLGLFAFGIVAGFGLAEAGLRAYASFDFPASRQILGYDPLAILIEPVGELGYRQKPSSIFRYPNGTSATSNIAGYRGPLVPIPKPAGRFRVVLLGRSTTHGYGVNDDETIDYYLRELLAQRFPGRQIDVVNLGFDGYDSYQDFERLRADGLPLEPDVVIVNSGINDVGNARLAELRDRDPRTLIYEPDLKRLRAEHAHGGPTIATLVKHYSFLARLGGVIRDRTITTRARALRRVPNPQAADYFERNLHRIAELLAPTGAALIFSTTPSALAVNFRPNASLPVYYCLADATDT